MNGTGDRRPNGAWITFEGIEGCGKSTQLERLAHRLAERGCPPLATREPGGTELGLQLRRLLLEPAERPMHPMTELLLYAADRAEHLSTVVIPALDRGRVILCDRFLDATLAYQGYGRELGTTHIRELHRLPPLDRRPDRTILLDLDPEQALARARRREEESVRGSSEARFEGEPLAFHRRVRDGYLELAAAEPARFRRIDASGSLLAVERRVRAALADLLPALGDDA